MSKTAPATRRMSDPEAQPAPETTAAPTTPEGEGTPLLCPYCGHMQRGGERCGDCGGLFEPLSRKATQIAMGPWYIRDKDRPFRPGCSFETLKRLVEAGKLSATTVLRGPTTRQFWALGRNTPGVANLIGYCHRCGRHIAPGSADCEHCGEVFKEPTERNALGLQYETEAEAVRAQKELDRQVNAAAAIAERVGNGSKPKARPAGEAPRAGVTAPSLDRPPAASEAAPGPTPRVSESSLLAAGTARRPATRPDGKVDLLREVLSEPMDDNEPTPSAQADGADDPLSDPPSKRVAKGGVPPVVWVFIGVNVVAALAVVLLFLMAQGG